MDLPPGLGDQISSITEVPQTCQPLGINKLPIEIIREIFVLGNSFPIQEIISNDISTNVAAVSRFWRSVALSEPRLWSKICLKLGDKRWLGGFDQFTSYLERSRGARIHLWIANYRGAPMDAQCRSMELAAPHLDRCYSLIYDDHEFHMPNAWIPLTHPFPSLKELDIFLTPRWRIGLNPEAIQLGPNLNLHEFKLSHSHLHTGFLAPFNVSKSLNLTKLPAFTVFSVLRRSPEIERLRISLHWTSILPSSLYSLSLRNLRTLEVDAGPFPYEIAPRLKLLRVAQPQSLKMLTSSSALGYADSLAMVKALDLRGWVTYGQGERYLVHFSSLFALSLRYRRGLEALIEFLAPDGQAVQDRFNTSDSHESRNVQTPPCPNLNLVIIEFLGEAVVPEGLTKALRSLLLGRSDITIIIDWVGATELSQTLNLLAGQFPRRVLFQVTGCFNLDVEELRISFFG
ncbi:uncharacterized protein EI90DRAFT_1330490 [Cantharellus anzutake]|uniref:uncharacterized protein n=1 Tax=Cantharellus anzutake TaxID=1750568 RepID=UPI001908BF8A|nr:uncharacterized protein EI90DRAFT_1330490 [Cantharellus anzutake]KAF8342319.1 hypothetical protein EI90DRAFT_1330490 [Cantharellus anzutake]